MAEKNNATCSICGKGYYACLSCADAMKLKPWQTHCCSSECFKVFQVVKGFNTNMYTKDEAKEKLQNTDLKDVESFRPHIRDIVKDVLKEEKAVAKTVEAKEDVVVKDVAKVEKTEDIVKPTTFRRKFNKMEMK